MKLKRLKTKVISLVSCLALAVTTLSSMFPAVTASALPGIGKADGISQSYLFGKGGTLDTLELNITKLPKVTYGGNTRVSGEIQDLSYTPALGNTQIPSIPGCEKGARVLWIYPNIVNPYGDLDDFEIHARFNGCGTINGSQSVDMEVTYSNIYVKDNDDGCFFSWTARGNFDEYMPDSKNEWFAVGVSDYNIKIRFYDSKTGALINLHNVFTTIYSLDGNYDANKMPYHLEGVSSDVADRAYVFRDMTDSQKDTQIGYLSTYYPPNYPYVRSYNDVYYGTASGSSGKQERLAVCFEYDSPKEDAIDYDIHIMNGIYSWGYHLRFNTMTGQLPRDPQKSVSHEWATRGQQITYTCKQYYPRAYNDDYYLLGIEFIDKLDSNLTYNNSAKVYDADGKDITSAAGSFSFTSGTLKYVFKESYLKTVDYTKPKNYYTVEFKATIKSNSTVNMIPNTFTTRLYSHNLGGNKVYDDLKSNEVRTYVYDPSALTFTKKQKTSSSASTSYSIPSDVTDDLEFLVYRLDHPDASNETQTYLVSKTGTTGNYTFSGFAPAYNYGTAPLAASHNAFVFKLDSSGKFKLNLPAGEYAIVEYTGSDIYTGLMKNVVVTTRKNSNTSCEGYNILPSGSVTVNKSFEGTTSALSGAKFNLTGTSDIGIDVDMTTAVTNGKAVFSNVPYGTYTLSETSVPTGYDAVAARKITVSSKNSNVSVNLTDPLTKGFLKIIKENEDGSIPNGIQFNIKSTYTVSGVKVDQTVTVANGMYYASLPVGIYTVTEIASSVPEDYLVADPQTVDVHDSDTFSSPATVKFVNKLAEGPITITKKLTESYYTQEEFVFEVSETDKGGNVNKFLAYIVIPAGKTSGSVTIDKCRNGRTYSVRELNTNWRYTPVNDSTYLRVNGKSPTAEHNYSKNTATNTLSFKAVALNNNDYECIFTNKGHDHWLDDGSTVSNVMKPIK